MRIHFSIRELLILTFLCTFAVACCTYWFKAMRLTNCGWYATPKEWPRALVTLMGNDESLFEEVEPYGLAHFIDHRSIWRIKSGSALRGKLFQSTTLLKTDKKHPMAADLIDSIPAAWRKPNWKNGSWFATPGYGKTRIEGTDLYLIVEDTESGQLIVLHEWNF